jgi:DNA modification methylase
LSFSFPKSPTPTWRDARDHSLSRRCGASNVSEMTPSGRPPAAPWRSRIVGHGEVAPGELVANERNWRSHPRQQQLALTGALDEVGWVQQVLVNRRTGRLVDGHLRVELAVAHGEAAVPVTYVDLSTEEEALVLATLDPIGAMAGADADRLAELLRDLEPDDAGLRQLLAELAGSHGIARDGLTDPDEIPAPPDEPTTSPGDLWELGEHRLLCGDAGSAADLDRLLGGMAVDVVITDPPYNVRVEPRSNNAIAAGISGQFDVSYGEWVRGANARRRVTKALDAQGSHHSRVDVARGRTGVGHHQKLDLARHPGKAQATHRKLRAKDRPLVSDFIPDVEFEKLLAAWFANASRVLRPGGSFYVWGGYANIANYPPALKGAGLYFSQAIVWDKEHPVLTRKDFMGAHELCFYGWKEGAAHRFHGPPNVPDIWHVKKVAPNSMVHLTEKPVELARRAIEYSSLGRETVLDLFAGSGSTLIAAQQTDRRACLIEIDPLYCDVIVERWQRFTGRTAERRDG